MPWATGNDVVDLGDPANARAHARPRFVDRVLGDAERRALAASTDPAALVWSFFAAKEAAFKLACKLGPRLPGEGTRPVFAHRLFEVDPALACVRHEGQTHSLRVRREGDWVHAVVWTDGEEPLTLVSDAPPGSDLGVEVRKLLTRTLAPLLACTPEMLSVVRPPDRDAWDDLGPPRLYRGGNPLEVDVSLSHDGRFVAFAACIPRLDSGPP